MNNDNKWEDFTERISNLKQHYLQLVGDSAKAEFLHDSLHLDLDKKIQNGIISNLKLDQKAAIAQRDLQIKKRNETEERLVKRRNQLILLSIFAFLISLVAYSIYRYQSLKKKSIESELEKTKIQATLDVTKAKMEGEQEERKVIASVLHDQVASLLTAADMHLSACLLYTSPSPRDATLSRMPSSA